MSETADSDQASDAVHLRLDVGYDGTGFSGWATQPGLRTVQGVLESALETVLRLPTGTCRLTVAGRTDAGVHARGQVCDVHLPSHAPEPDRLRSRLNGLLPDDVVVRRSAAAPDGFDARFSAIWRRYAYRIYDRPEAVDPLRRRDVLRRPRPLDEHAMNDAAMDLLGEHDFAAFCKRRDGASTLRDLRELSWARDGGMLTCRVVADAFCHHQVRSLVGCLIEVGEGRRPASWPAEVLAARARDPRVTVVPARGLTLEEVGYPPDGALAARAAEARVRRRPSGAEEGHEVSRFDGPEDQRTEASSRG